MVRATSSLPVPVSPVITTEADEDASRSMATITRRIAGERPNRDPTLPAGGCGGVEFLRRASRAAILVSIALSPVEVLWNLALVKIVDSNDHMQRKLNCHRSAESDTVGSNVDGELSSELPMGLRVNQYLLT